MSSAAAPPGLERLAASPLARLEYLNAVGIALSSERDTHRLLETILVAAKALTRADGGTLYRVVDGVLRFEIVRNDTLGIALGGASHPPPGFPPLPLVHADGRSNHDSVASHAAISGRTVNIGDAYEEAGFDFAGAKAFDRQNGYRSTSFLTVPMRNHEGEVIGVLQLINAMGPGATPMPFDSESERLAESLASQAAVALTNRLLIDQLQALFESLVKLINTAIDEKSPYTGGHCNRVPALTMMLAEAAHEATTGPLADFRMTEKDRYELQIAGLLHDCGKITTPVHVVDKATKLQAIHDRIALVAMRFRAAKAAAEARMWRAVADAREAGDEAGAAQARVACASECEQLDDDLAFLERANIGGERMRPEDQARVRSIAERCWSLPGGLEEPLLTDEEMENLVIPFGTLLPKERDIINHHIVATIRMLEALPWPRHLARVPEYAGGHHERMDGKGYPRGLTREQMSVPARIMAIADIFEALTAADRPYKPPKTLSESLAILAKMREGNHIDPDLFDLFVREKVYLRYARAFLPASQIDDVDLSRLPGFTP